MRCLQGLIITTVIANTPLAPKILTGRPRQRFFPGKDEINTALILNYGLKKADISQNGDPS